MPVLRRVIAASENTLIESNSVLNFLRPDIYVFVLDYAIADMKDSARRFLDRADALVTLHSGQPAPWPGIPARWLESKAVLPCRAARLCESGIGTMAALSLRAAKRPARINRDRCPSAPRYAHRWIQRSAVR
jgi:hypothetical protein